jgi:signal transduction histidine kinase
MTPGASRDQLISWLTHDLRGPLTGIRAMAESLEDGIATDAQAYFRQIQTEVQRLTLMVEDLSSLAIANANAMQSRLAMRRVPLGEVVEAAVASADPVAHACGVDLVANQSLDLDAVVDPAEFSRAVMNLLLNAIRHTPSGGTVSVSGGAGRDTVELSVSDCCGGMTDETLVRSFEPSWQGRADQPVGKSGVLGKGSGLGLSIVKSIVEAHRGTVSVSNRTEGCQFLVSLPVAV